MIELQFRFETEEEMLTFMAAVSAVRRSTAVDLITCEICGTKTEAGIGTRRRRDAKYCSNRCRVAAGRQRQKSTGLPDNGGENLTLKAPAPRIPLTSEEQPKFVSVPDAGRSFGIGANAAYRAAKRGEIKTVRIGGRVLVPTAWLANQSGNVNGK